MYWEKRGMESVHMRILSCAQPNNARALGSYLSYDDLIQLVTRCIGYACDWVFRLFMGFRTMIARLSTMQRQSFSGVSPEGQCRGCGGRSFGQ